MLLVHMCRYMHRNVFENSHFWQSKNCKLCRGHPEERTVQGFAARFVVTRNGTRVQLDRIPPTREHLGESPVMFFLVGDLGTGRPAAWK